MSQASNSALILEREPLPAAPEAGRPAVLPAVQTAMQPEGPGAWPAAAACQHAAAVLDVVEELTTGAAGEGARLARQAQYWAMRKSHDAHWTPGLTAAGAAELEPAGSFGDGHLTTPCGLEGGADGNLWAACLGGERVSVLSPEGRLVRQVALPGSRPWGLFRAASGGLWVCDFGRSRLLLLDAEGVVQRETALHLPGPEGGLRPILGADAGDWLYLLLADGRGGGRRLARIRPELTPLEQGGQAELLPCPLAVPSAVRVHAGRLYLSGQNPPLLLSRSLAGGGWTLVNQGLIPEYLTQFCFLHGQTWLAAKGRLTRLDEQGAVARCIDAGALAGYPEGNFCDLAGLDRADGRYIYVTDNVQDLIHGFRVR